MNPIPNNPTLNDLLQVVREHHVILNTLLQKEADMPCGVSTTATSCLPSIAPFFECCGRLKTQVFKCEAPTGCAGATFPVGLQINVNEWPSMGEYPVYALKLFDCVGGKAYVGLLGAVNGVVKYGLDVKIPNTAAASAIKLTIVDPVTGATIEGQEINIGLAPATNFDETSGTGTTSPGLVLDSGVTVTGPFEATIGTPDRSAWDGLWAPSTNNDQGILFTTEQRMWTVNGAKLDTGVTAVKTIEDDGFTFTAIDIGTRAMVNLAGSHPVSGTTVGALCFAPNETPAAGGVNAAVYGMLLDSTWTGAGGDAALAAKMPDGKVWSGWFSGDIYVGGDATLAGAAFGGWADYVLEPDYELMHLDDVAKYINEHKTLPEMPSADEVAAGHGVGEMLKTIVAQLEKQMLYILQLDARLEMEGI